MVNARRKGNCYELKIGHILSEQFSPVEFKRNPLSGGWDKGISDLTPWIENRIVFFAFGLECKNDKSMSLKDWFRQSIKAVKRTPKVPVVIFHKPRVKGMESDDFIVINKDLLVYYLKSNCKPIEFVEYTDTVKWKLNDWMYEVFSVRTKSIRCFFIGFEEEILTVLRFQDFLSIIDKRKVRNKVWATVLKKLYPDLFTE